MLINIAVLFEKIFLYGALLWLGRMAFGELRHALWFVVLLTASVEIAQVYIPGHTAEITDPLLVLFLAFVLESLRFDRARLERPAARQ